ncbi:MAG: LacI family DNA-binding transcriptional regulator [Lachnospiraceae bacterium]|nr:LacI family DNA-binding transcriptional regulator [Lachnospiraceae bacterium]MDY5741824.1 LacI family DNA-binding transcriptional regulator [Lachnospiraceae bacterium]
MNIYDIAKKAAVSPTTVSRVLNGNKAVRRETKERVLKVIDDMNYVPSSVARSLSVKGTSNIAVIVPDITNPFFSSILSGITQTADEYEYNTFLFGTGEDPKKQYRVLQTVKAENLKGIIIVPVFENDEETVKMLKELEGMNVPIVLIDREINGGCFDGVFSNDREGSYRAVKKLIDTGHRKIAVIKGPLTSRPGRERYEGYVRAMTEAGIEIREEYSRGGSFLLDDLAYEDTHKLMTLSEPPTAIFTANNMASLGCMKCLFDMGLTIGKDISLVGFDDIETLKYLNIDLSVVDRPVQRMGMEAMELLQLRFCEQKEDRGITRKIIIDTELILRGSEQIDKNRLEDPDGSLEKIIKAKEKGGR